MKAAVLYEFGKPLVIEEVDLDPPGPGEVKVRIAAASICHSDIHDFKGEHGITTFPTVGGHEAAGFVEEVGEGVTYVKPGDPVVVTIVTAGCGKCYNCLKGLPKLCEKNRSKIPDQQFTGLTGPGRYVNKQGERLSQISGRMAAFAEVFSSGHLPQDIPELIVAPLGEKMLLSKILVEGELISSNSEARRLIQQGGVKVDGSAVRDIKAEISTIGSDPILLQEIGETP